nr:GNAT family N-acetyltransferase [uncultured Desulfuromonas sp.]
MPATTLTLKLPGQLEFLPVAMAFIQQTAQLFGFADNEVASVQLATEEALVYTMNGLGINGLAAEDPQEIRLECRYVAGRMELSIYDKGLPVAPGQIPRYDPTTLMDDAPLHKDSLSLFLLQQAMDEVHFRNLGRGGKETLLIKHVAAKRIDPLTPSSPKPPETPVALTTWQVRPFIPDDALEISRCAYRAYGYSYESYIYYPEQIVEMNRSGTLRSYVAVDDQQTLLGHAALKFYHPHDPVAEAGVLFVNPAYRKKGIFDSIHRYLFKQAGQENLAGLYSRAVTSHALSQKKLHASGCAGCGLLLGLFPDDVEFKKLTGKTVQKESALLVFKAFNASLRQIYPPKQHSNMIGDIFHHCEVPVTMEAPQVPTTQTDRHDEDCKLSYTRMDIFNTADILCFSNDAAMADEIFVATKRLCLERTDVLYLFLDLEQPGCDALCEASEKMGFFFCGVLPFGLHGRHTLILQYLNNLAIDFARIDLCDPFARQVAAYVENSSRHHSIVALS